MLDPKLIAAQLDARVLVALDTVPDSEPIDAVAQAAGVDMMALRASMRRLALRAPGVNWPKMEA